MTRGRYIVLEGGEAVGKTTQAELLASHLGGEYVPEPGGSDFAIALRRVLLDKELPRPPISDVLGHASARAASLEAHIKPNLASGRHVVADRNWISSLAYQGAQGVDITDIADINEKAMGSYTTPDLLILLDADPRESHMRLQGEKDYYESYGEVFHQEVRRRYTIAARNVGGVIIDAMQSVEVVQEQIQHTVHERFGL